MPRFHVKIAETCIYVSVIDIDADDEDAAREAAMWEHDQGNLHPHETYPSNPEVTITPLTNGGNP